MLVAADQTAELVDGVTFEPIAERMQFAGSGPRPPAVAFRPDGAVAAIGSLGGVITFIDARTGARLGEPLIEPSLLATYKLAWSADGTRLYAGGVGTNVYAGWDVATRQPLFAPRTLAGNPAVVQPITLRDGRLIMFPFFNYVALIDPDSGTEIARVVGKAGPSGVAVSPDEQTIAIGRADGTMQFTRAADLSPLGEPFAVFSDVIGQFSYTPDGSRLVVRNQSNKVKIVEVATHEVYEPALPTTAVQAGPAKVSPDGKFWAAAGTSGGVVLWEIDPTRWAERACQLVGRNLTAAEWAKYLPNDDGPHRKTCDQWPLDAS